MIYKQIMHRSQLILLLQRRSFSITLPLKDVKINSANVFNPKVASRRTSHYGIWFFISYFLSSLIHLVTWVVIFLFTGYPFFFVGQKTTTGIFFAMMTFLILASYNNDAALNRERMRLLEVDKIETERLKKLDLLSYK